jgi:hypothetical protein
VLFRRYSFSIKYDTFETRLGTDNEQDRIEWVNLLRNLITKLKLQKRKNSSDKNDPKSTTQSISNTHNEENSKDSLLPKSEHSSHNTNNNSKIDSDTSNTLTTKEDILSTSSNISETNL